MAFLLESPIALGAIGLLVVTVAGIAYVQLRSAAALGLLAGALLLAIGALVGERLWLTPTERIQQTIIGLLDAIEENDLRGVLSHIDPQAATMRADAETLMPMFLVERTGSGTIAVELTAPDRAIAELKPLIKVQHKQSGAMGAYFDQLTLDLVERNGSWLVSDYEPAQDWRTEAGKLGR